MTTILFERKTTQGTWLLLSSAYGLTDQIISRRLDDYKRQFNGDTVRARNENGQLVDIR
jgi:hypothetical protein